MSEQDLALVRRFYEAINSIGRTREEFIDPEEIAPDLWAGFAPEIELHGRPDVPDVGVHRGPEGLKEFWRMLQDTFSELHWEPKGLIDLGHAVVVETRLTAVGRGSDLRIESDETDVFWFRDGELVRLQGFPTKAEAMAAAESPLP